MAESASYADSIALPTDEIFRNLKNAKWFAMDIGGALAKLAYYSTISRKRSLVTETESSSSAEIYCVVQKEEMCDHLHFIKFETRYIETCLSFIRENLLGSRESMQGKIIKVTGGGAHRYKDILSNTLGVQVDKEDEMECLIKGCNFLLKNITDEAYIYQKHANVEYRFQTIDTESIFPYLLVNIGSGVSIFKVESESVYERIAGTSIGGGTFWGLGSILTKARGFDELLALAERGDHRNIDMLVKDIYGGAYSLLGLPADLIASSFGKAVSSAQDSNCVPSVNFHDADIAKSLLITISNDIGQIASLNAQLHSLKRIYFGGYFIRGHQITMHTITYAINYWSKGTIQPLFLRHEGYLGAIGAFLKGAEEEDFDKYSWDEKGSWGENYACSSGLQSPKFDILELDRFAKPLVSCPVLLDPASYFPDTDDLTQDKVAREYWLRCFEDATGKLVERAIHSQASTTDATQRAARFREKYLRRLKELHEYPCAYGTLTVRSLLDTREQCMQEFHFADPYLQQKQQDNEKALKLLDARLKSLDAMTWEERHLSVIKGLLAGNVFDWGAKHVAALMESSEGFGFTRALEEIKGARLGCGVGGFTAQPWLFDDFEEWLERMRGEPHNCAVIFVDNSGMDIIVGVFPFVRELLNRGTQVILCANSRPALNDVTYNELTILTKRVAAMSHDVEHALQQGQLLVMESGQASPCLDLRYIDFDLSEMMRRHGTDLIVLEGMGRAIHTNLHAVFSCESLKVAILKNEWLANRLGGKMFSVVFRYEKGRKVVSQAHC
ncbi:4'-phosphopantetheine phosphatase [Lamellibrachia satsuma]|nr:4'-phosphopantetheine phosphatase [Lamellibrachia satsuma]